MPYTAARIRGAGSSGSDPHTARGVEKGLGRHTNSPSRVGCSRQHHSMASSPSAAFLRLRAFIAERMRMSPIDQPLMH
ncbi:hypothetical protein ICNINCKA_01524 [Synechococcus sp. CBW1107]|nr:hypothetical protein ICNINCKA_01524 [Synechococcus sp. CBW1107]